MTTRETNSDKDYDTSARLRAIFNIFFGLNKTHDGVSGLTQGRVTYIRHDQLQNAGTPPPHAQQTVHHLGEGETCELDTKGRVQ